MTSPIPLIPGGYPAEFVDALAFAEESILDYMKDSLKIDYTADPVTTEGFAAYLADLFGSQVTRAIRAGFLMGAQWQSENPNMPIDRKPR